jgi:O-antigen/teichoic acid export membrane protein
MAINLKILSRLNTSFNRNIFYNSAGAFTYAFSQYMLTIVILRMKGAEDAGVYSLAYTFTNIFTTISSFGMSSYQISDVTGRHSDGTYVAARLCTSLAAILCFAAALPFTNFSRVTLLCCAVLMLYRILEGIAGVYLCVLQKSGDYRTIGISNCIKGVFPFAAFCAVFYFSGLPQAVSAMSAAFLLVFLMFDFPRVTGRADFTAKAVKSDIINVLLPSFMFVLQGLTYFGMTFFSRYVIEKTYSIEELGYFSSITIIMLIFPILSGPVLGVFIPGLSGLYAEKKYGIIKRMTFRMGLCVIAGTVVICLSSFIWGGFVLKLVFGEAILSYRYLLLPTLLASCFMLGCNVICSVLIAAQNRLVILIAGVAAALTVILTCPALVRRFYMNGSIYSLIAAFAVEGIIILGALIRHLREPRNIKDVSAVTDNGK